MGKTDKIFRGATISPCKLYRYELYRKWGAGNRLVAFIGLNPSTADHQSDDPTIRRCIAFAKSWGYDGLTMFNLFAFRATNPLDMKAAIDPIGPDNDDFLRSIYDEHECAVAAWGNDGEFLDRAKYVMSLIHELYYLKLNNNGSPAHPLYLPKTLTPIRYQGRLQ